MIANFLRSKAGVLCTALLVCGVFFTLSKLKDRNADKTERQTLSVGAAGPMQVAKEGGAENAALLKRAQDNARGRAEAARTDAKRSPGSSYDETGDVYQRRITPEPMANELINGTGLAASGPTERSEPHLVPSLRIRGRAHAEPTAPRTLPGLEEISNKVASAGKGGKPGLEPQRREATVQPRPQRFVPYGRLIKAELVITLESTQDEMPLVGLIVEPVYNNGRLVIPAGTEVHSMARPDRVRDRIISVSTWKLIFPREGSRPNGRQLTFEAVALDREDRNGENLTWGLTDGSYGLRGRTVKVSQTAQELLLFSAEALKAAGASMMDRQTTLTGTQVDASAKNAALAGSQAVLTQFAERIARELERNGVFIQVPAGKQFYVYPKQIIDADRADIPTNVAKVE